MPKKNRDYNDISSGNISSSATKQKILKKQKTKDIFKKTQSKDIFSKDTDENKGFTFQSSGGSTGFTFETAYENKDKDEDEKYVFVEFMYLGNEKDL